jgi:hypothetical protein
MATVIFKWNPSFSSYSMAHYLYDIINANNGETDDFDWSVWDHDKIHDGDQYYWLKLGFGQVGIVGHGIISSEPWLGEDWSGKGRETYYVNFKPKLLLNPDALPILTSSKLSSCIPDFEWDHGHSGLVLNRVQAEKLDLLWNDFVNENHEEFEKKAHADRSEIDYIYWDKDE